MKIAIVGSRTFMDTKLVERVIRRLLERDPEIVIVSGGARGADTLAEKIARKLCKHPPIVVPADWSKGKGAGFARNQQIVSEADEVICFWDGASRGSQDTCRRAFAVSKPLYVYHEGQNRWLLDDEIASFMRPARPTQPAP